MDDLSLAIVVQLVGVALLVLEVFLPSHGLFGLAGLGCLTAGVYMGFRVSPRAGYVSLAAAIIIVPSLAGIGVKFFRRTAIGRRVVPPNPVLTAADTGVDTRDLRPLIGATGRSVSPLRPVGACEFNGRRVQCVAEYGLIEPGVSVKGVGIVGDSLAVRPVDAGQKT